MQSIVPWVLETLFIVDDGLHKHIVKMKLFNLFLVFLKPLMKEMNKTYLMTFFLI